MMSEDPDRIHVGEHVIIYPRGKKRIWCADFWRDGQHCRQSLKTTNKKIALHRALHLDAQLAGPAAYLAQLVGRGPAFARAPYGALNPNVIAIAHRQGLRVLGWSVDPSDYQRPPAGTIVSRVLSQVHPGAIVLMHDGGGDRSPTIAALPSIIAALRAQGYTFVQPQVSDASAPPQTMLVGSVRFRSLSHRRRVPRPRRGVTPGSSRPCFRPRAPSSPCPEGGL